MAPTPRWHKRMLLLAALTTTAAGGCAVNPVTGERQLSLVSESQEVQIGQQAAQEAAQSIGLVEDPALQAYVQRIGAGLAARSERPNLPWSFRVVDDPTPNAFALPGGPIFVTRGLLGIVNSEAELASVLGHEIGHVTARHSVTQISRAQLAQIGLGVGSVLFPGAAQQLGGLASGGLQLLFLSYGRDAERQADDLGFRYARGEGYDVREMADVFRALERVGETEGRSPLPSWLATHPAPAERIRAVEARVDTANLPAGLVGRRAEYLQRVDGLVYGDDPRKGYFRDGVFLHPELRFRIAFPQGWATQNLPQAVTAVSPRKDAIMQLILAEGAGSPEAAAQRFFSQGVQQGQTGRETVNGLPAVVGYFRAQTQQGVVDGVAAWVSYGGRVYQVIAYTGGGQLGAYDRVFRQTLGSFAQLSDPQALGVQPSRIRVVRVDRRMTLAEFNQRFPSAIPLPELAVVNGVADANSVLPAGSQAKRVVAGTAGAGD
ncbi:MAG TPA: M48 family metalloprotease [Longimicrobiaceae bacterium]|nr:M48 family metalloprotease [Longimicrobiaceae bacterium]